MPVYFFYLSGPVPALLVLNTNAIFELKIILLLPIPLVNLFVFIVEKKLLKALLQKISREIFAFFCVNLSVFHNRITEPIFLYF